VEEHEEEEGRTQGRDDVAAEGAPKAIAPRRDELVAERDAHAHRQAVRTEVEAKVCERERRSSVSRLVRRSRAGEGDDAPSVSLRASPTNMKQGPSKPRPARYMPRTSRPRMVESVGLYLREGASVSVRLADEPRDEGGERDAPLLVEQVSAPGDEDVAPCVEVA